MVGQACCPPPPGKGALDNKHRCATFAFQSFHGAKLHSLFTASGEVNSTSPIRRLLTRMTGHGWLVATCLTRVQ